MNTDAKVKIVTYVGSMLNIRSSKIKVWMTLAFSETSYCVFCVLFILARFFCYVKAKTPFLVTPSLEWHLIETKRLHAAGLRSIKFAKK